MATDVTPIAAAPDSDADTPPRPTTTKPTGFLAYANGALKRHYPTAPSAVPESPAPPPPPSPSYKECMRNHAASIGGHALDGCCEFMPSPAANPADPTSLRCAACACHRNFHRRDPDDPAPLQLHRQIKIRVPESPASPPTPATFSSAPHMLMELRQSSAPASAPASGPAEGGKKRHRTKFSKEQKEKMNEFAERLGWKLQKVDKGMVEDFCNQIGVGREVLKVWMHNNKIKNSINCGNGTVAAASINNNGDHRFEQVHLVAANRSSSSSD